MNQEKIAVQIGTTAIIISAALITMLGCARVFAVPESMPEISSLTTERRTDEVVRVAIERVEETTPVEVSTMEETETQEEVHKYANPTYQISGIVMDVNLQGYLYQALNERGYADWFPIAICQAYQESNFDINCISTHKGENNDDCGLFQFKEKWWNYYSSEAGIQGDIFDPYTQIDVYVFWVCKWMDSGCSESQTLSNWYTGGQGYTQEYVDQVIQWTERIGRYD